MQNAVLNTSFLDNILSKGGTENPMTLYKRFRGKKPDPTALLRRAGLIPVSVNAIVEQQKEIDQLKKEMKKR